MIALRILQHIMEAMPGRPAPIVSISFVSLEEKGAIINYPFCKCTSSNYYNNTITVALYNEYGKPQLDDKNKQKYRTIKRVLIVEFNSQEVML